MQRCAAGVVQDREDHVEVDVQRNPAGERAEAEGSDGSSEALLDVHPHRVGLDDLPLPWSRLWFCWRPGARRCGEINWHGTRWVAFSPPKPRPGRVMPCSAAFDIANRVQDTRTDWEDLLRGCHRRRLRSAISVCPPLRLWGSSASPR